MTAQSTMKHQFNQADLDILVDRAVKHYKERLPVPGVRSALERVEVAHRIDILPTFAKKLAEGYTCAEGLDISIGIGQLGQNEFYVCRPQPMQDADIAEITQEVTDRYNAERKRLYQQHLDFIVQESMEREKREQERKAAVAAEKAKAKFEQEALEALGKFE